MPREFSAGGVVVHHMQERWWVAAIEPRRDSTEKAKKRVLALPKGLVDPGEKPEQAALREVREEAGVEAELITKLGDVKYVYVRSWGDGQKVFKIVSFYLLRYRSGELGKVSEDMKIEVAGAEWLPLEDAARLLSYGGEREMASKAAEYVAAHLAER